MSSLFRYCRNPKCHDLLPLNQRGVHLCASCRYLGKRALALGAFVGGLIVAIVKWRMGR